MRFLILFLLSFLLSRCVPPQTSDRQAPVPKSEFLDAFSQITQQTQTISYTNEIEVEHKGGHLQGIQRYRSQGKDQLILSGSSSSYSYFASLPFQDSAQVDYVHHILPKPLKHAGGIQVWKQFLAIGVEDNEARDRSQVMIYNLADSSGIPSLVTNIPRKGPRERPTAGCIGITQTADNILLVAGNWDTRDLDFYVCSLSGWESGAVRFDSVFTLHTPTWNQQQPAPGPWLSYQNINLFTDSTNQVFMAGMARNQQGKDVADIYLLTESPDYRYQLKWLARKVFPALNTTSFQLGAGIYWESGQPMQLLSCDRNLKADGLIQVIE